MGSDVDVPNTTALEARVKDLEAEVALWQNRYHRLMGWVQWLRDDVCRFNKRAGLRLAQGWAGLNRVVGQEDLFMASLEIEAEVRGDDLILSQFAIQKDEQFRTLSLKAAEGSVESGRAKGQEA